MHGWRVGTVGARVWGWVLLKTGPDPCPGSLVGPDPTNYRQLHALHLRGARSLPHPHAPGCPPLSGTGGPRAVCPQTEWQEQCCEGRPRLFQGGCQRRRGPSHSWRAGWGPRWSRSRKATTVPEPVLGGLWESGELTRSGCLLPSLFCHPSSRVSKQRQVISWGPFPGPRPPMCLKEHPKGSRNTGEQNRCAGNAFMSRMRPQSWAPWACHLRGPPWHPRGAARADVAVGARLGFGRAWA